MSWSTGPGSPVFFRCGRARRQWFGKSVDHTVRLTGRTRPYKPSRGHAPGLRSTRISREYECECGYRGWSNHVDLERLEAS